MPKTAVFVKSPFQCLSYDGKMNDSGLHKHKQAQLIYCSSGTFEFEIAEKKFLVPPSNAIWIPSWMPHCGYSKKIVHYRSIYFDVSYFKSLPKHMHVIGVSALLKALIEKACRFEKLYKTNSPEARLAKVIVDEILTAEIKSYHLPLPTHPKLCVIHAYLFKHLSKNYSCEQVAEHFAMSSKTLSRLCKQHLGMTLATWRQQMKLLKAIELLSYHKSTTEISRQLGYSNDSAFIEAFKRLTGETPTQFKQQYRDC
jgi:AraC-like DNA-binding protein